MFTKAVDAMLASPAPTKASVAEDLYIRRSQTRIQLQAYREALADLDEAVRLSSGSVKAWTARADHLIRMGELRSAEADLDRAVKIQDDYAPALISRGRLRLARNEPAAARDDFASAAKADPSLAEAHREAGRLELQVFGDLDEAARHLTTAVRTDAEDEEAWLHLGDTRLRQGQAWEAIEALDKAHTLKARVDVVLRLRAEAHHSLGNISAAMQDIRAGLEAAPGSSPLFTSLGSFRVAAHRFPQAIEDLERALDIDGRDARAYLLRGKAYAGIGEYRRAARDLKKAIKYSREKPLAAMRTLCQVERLWGRASRAVRTCSDALGIDPEDAETLAQRGLAYARDGEFSRAVRDLDDAERLGFRRPQTLLARAWAHAVLRQYSQATRAYREAMAIDFLVRSTEHTLGEEPLAEHDFSSRILAVDSQIEADGDDPYSYLVRGDALHSAGQFDRAVLEYTRALEIDGRLTMAYLARGSALAAQESLDAAEQDMRQAVKLDGNDPLTHLHLVTLLTARGKYSQGLKSVVTALRAQTEDPYADTYVKAGNLRYFMKNTGRALENFQYALKFSPHNPAAHNGIGLSHFSRKQYRKAILAFSRAIASHPDYDRYYRNRASTYVNLGMYQNAARDYRLALSVNRDPGAVPEYERLIKNSDSLVPKDEPSEKEAPAMQKEPEKKKAPERQRRRPPSRRSRGGSSG